MRVLLIGANGYLGRYVADRLLADPAVQLTALGRGDDADVRFDLATGSPGALTRFLDAVHPGVVINCAGATRGGARELTRHNTVAVATICESRGRAGGGAPAGPVRERAQARATTPPPSTPQAARATHTR
ncbi:NAD-dependent epimerase/dehydratase family protein, partial [Streptomyces lavendulae]|uniref:NAD-dependent epimerase/dehydratase family protein n=1 Tax=Streptomyces lavendulae TaxID=1914 RepID=UPI0036943C3F